MAGNVDDPWMTCVAPDAFVQIEHAKERLVVLVTHYVRRMSRIGVQRETVLAQCQRFDAWKGFFYATITNLFLVADWIVHVIFPSVGYLNIRRQ